MHKTLTRSFLSAFVAFSALFTPVSGDYHEPGFGCSRWDCCQYCPKLGAAQSCCDDCGFISGFDILYWRANQSDLDYVVDGVRTVCDDTSLNDDHPENLFAGKHLHFPEYDWDTGFRLNFGYRFGCDGWDAQLVYNYFNSKANDHQKLSDHDLQKGKLLEAVIIYPSEEFFSPQKACARNRINYQTLDFLVSRPFCVSETLIMRPFMGLRALWLDQDLTARYEGLLFQARGPSLPETKVHWEGQTTGVGLIAGLQSNIHICGGISLYGRAAASILAGQMKYKHKQQVPNISAQGSETSVNGLFRQVVDLEERQNVPVASYELGAGITCETCICDYCTEFGLGYDFVQWMRTARIRRYFNNAHPASSTGAWKGSLLLHGLTFKANFYF